MHKLTTMPPSATPERSERYPAGLRSAALEALYAARVGGYYATGVSDGLTRLLSTPLRPRNNTIRRRRNLPVLLLHGLAHNQSWSVKIARELKAAGFAPQPINYQTFGLTIDECADSVAEQILDAASSRSTAVHVAGHSLGGLVLRSAINRHPELDDIVATGITIGTPNQGTPWAFTGARLIPRVGTLIEEIRPGSETLAIIDEQTRSSDTQWISIYSTFDQLVPGHHGRLDHPRMQAKNYELGGLGHFGVTSNPIAVETIVDCLSRADACHTPAVRLPRQQTRSRLAMTV